MPEVSPQKIRDPAPVLNQDGPVEPQFVPHGLDLSLLCRGPEDHQNGVARDEVDQAEYQDGNQPQDGNDRDEAADDDTFS